MFDGRGGKAQQGGRVRGGEGSRVQAPVWARNWSAEVPLNTITISMFFSVKIRIMM